MDPFSFDSFFDGGRSVHQAEIDKLKSKGIVNRATWKKWCVENHPDKNKNVDASEVAEVNAMVNTLITAGVW